MVSPPVPSTLKIQTESTSQATEFEIRQRNAKFSNAVRAGKNPVHPSRRDALAKRSPINIWALGVIIFVVIGGGTPSDLTPHLPHSDDIEKVLFEIARLIFL